MSEPLAKMKVVVDGDTAAANAAITTMQKTGTAATDRLARDFEQLRIRSEMEINLQRQSTIAAFEAIKTSGMASAVEISRAQEALQARLRMLDAAVNPGKQAIRELNNEILAMQATGAAVTDRLSKSFDRLGVSSDANYNHQRQTAIAAFEAIKASGVASAQEISRAQEALQSKLRSLDAAVNPGKQAIRELNNEIRAMQASGTAVSDRLTPMFNQLGVRSAATIKAEIASINTALASIKASGTMDEIGRASTAAKNKLAQLNAELNNSKTASFQLQANQMGLVESLRMFTSVLLPLGIAGFFAGVIKGSIDAAIAIDRINTSAKAIHGAATASELAYIRAESDRLGLSYLTTADAYNKFSASTKGTSLEGDPTHKIFSGVSEAVTALKLSSEQANGIFLAMTQMMSKGRVSAEELVQQLGERLPGAVKLAADAMGMSTQELLKQMEMGNVMATDLLPRLADQLHKTYGAAALEAAKGPQAEINRFNNALLETKAALGDGLMPVFTDVLNGLKWGIGLLKDFIGGWQMLAVEVAGLTHKAWYVYSNGGIWGMLYGKTSIADIKKEFSYINQAMDEQKQEIFNRLEPSTSYTTVKSDAAQQARKAEEVAKAYMLDQKLRGERRAIAEASLLNDLELSKQYGQLELAQLENQFGKGLVAAQAYWERKNQITRAALDEELSLLNNRQAQITTQLAIEKDPEQKLKLQKQLLDLDKQRNDLAMNYNMQQVKSADERQKALAKELAFETSHLQTMQQIENAKLTALGYDQAALAVKTGYGAALLQERILQDQITTEISPRRAAQLQQQLEAQREVNRLVREQAEEQLRITQLQDRLRATTEAISISQALGADTKQLVIDQTRLAYDVKRAELQKQLNTAKKTENGLLASITNNTITQLDQLWAQKDASAAQLEQLQKILGVQQSISAETSKQKNNNDLIDEYNSSITITRSRDEQYQHDKYLTSTEAYGPLLQFYGNLTSWVRDYARERVLAYENEMSQKQLIDDQKKLATSMQSAADRLGQASVNLANSGSNLAAALRTAETNLLTAKVTLAGGTTTTLTPEQRLAMLRSQFTQMAATAQATGDVTLFNQLPDLARQLLEASQSYNASGAGFAADYELIQQILGESATSAGTYADSAEQMVTLLQQQADLLTAIKTALETGGDTANLLSELNTVNGQITTAVNAVDRSVGQTTEASLNIASGVTAVGTSTDNVANAAWSTSENALSTRDWVVLNKNVSEAINSQVASNTISTATWLTAVNNQTAAVGSYTARTRDVMDGSLLASKGAGRLSGGTQTYKYKENAPNQIDTVTDTYSYYAAGGYYPGGSAIMGELGPEFVDSSPGYVYRADETKALFAMAKRGAARADNGSSVGDLKAVIAELKAANRSLVATVQTLQAGLGEVVNGNKKIEKRLAGVESKARLAAAA